MRARRIAAVALGLAGAVLPLRAAEDPGAALIEPQLGTIFWTTITFLILAWLLGRFAWKPLLGALEQREKSIEATIEQARRDRTAAEELLGQQRELLDQARRERHEAVAAGRRDAERLRAEILDEARGQRDDVLRQAEAQIQAAVRDARAELRAATVDLAIGAAEKLITAKLDDAKHRSLVEEYLADLEQRQRPRPS